MDTDNNDPGKRFVYTALDPSLSPPSIRLVELLPASRSDPIELRLQVVRLTECPPYEALSYCWGTSADKATILCNGDQFDITTSLESALLYLRHTEEPRLLWIDQIAINQSDKEEKSHQILFMRDIYIGAQRTLVWLGEPNSDSKLAIDFIHRLFNAVAASEIPFGSFAALNFEDIHGRSVKIDDPHAPTDQESAVLVRLFKRPWFSRSWILQEVAVSEKVDVVCGEQEVKFDILIAVLCFSVLISNFINLGRPEWLHNVLTVSSVRNWTDKNGKGLELFSMLRATRRFGAANPRDKIFALCGITSTDLKAFDIKPDYRSSTAEIYTHASYSILHNTGNLDLLEVPHGHTEISDQLPSWVPDWSDSYLQPTSLKERHGDIGQPFSQARQRKLLNTFVEAQLVPTKESDEGIDEGINGAEEDLLEDSDVDEDNSNMPVYTATKSTSSSPSVISDRILVLSGHIVDKIETLGGILIAPVFDNETLHSWVNKNDKPSAEQPAPKSVVSALRDFVLTLMEWDKIALDDKRFKNTLYQTGESQSTAFRQTLCAGWLGESEAQTEVLYQEWRKSFRGARLTSKIHAFNLKMPGILTLAAAMIGSVTSKGGVKVFAGMMEVSLRRRLARTVSGRLALVPPETQSGDLVALLEGGSVPFVLRSTGGAWKLVGASYVHGIMNGEAFDKDSCSSVCIL